MNALEPHPVLVLPTQEDVDERGAEWFNSFCLERSQLIEQEKRDPFYFGFKPKVWDLVDDLLVDGNKVVLDVERIAELGGELDAPIEIAGASEIWISGSQRSSKSEYAGRKCSETILSEIETRGWSFADTETISRARQQPVVWKYLPYRVRQLCARTGKFRQGQRTNVSYNPKTGFSNESLLLEGSQHWFKNYEQDIANVEGDKLDIVWFDELRDPSLLKTIRFRMGDRGGIIIATFTPIRLTPRDENYSAIVNEYDRGARTLLEIPAELLPLRDHTGNRTGKFEKVPRIKTAGPGSDGNQKANIVYFHITDNPYYGFDGRDKRLIGKERFYKLFPTGTNREKILERAYGILTQVAARQFPRFNDTIHVVAPDKIPAQGTNFHIVDPCESRNWAMIWVRIDEKDRWWVYREWPSFGHAGAYIDGIGDPCEWALPGKPADGERGPASYPFGFGLNRYKEEILNKEKLGKNDDGEMEYEEIADRYMDSRYGATPTTTMEGSTTLIEQMQDIGMDFLAASGKQIDEGVQLINNLLDFDSEEKLGVFSNRLQRLNEPRLFVSKDCPNVIYALREWTGRDGNKGACKDFVDCLRYACLANIAYIPEEAYSFVGGGSY